MESLPFPLPRPIHQHLRKGASGRDVSPQMGARVPVGPRRARRLRSGVWAPVPSRLRRPGLTARPAGLTCSAVLPKRFRASGCTSSRCRRRRTSRTSPRAAAPLSRSPARTSSSSMATPAWEAPRPTRHGQGGGSHRCWPPPPPRGAASRRWAPGPARQSRAPPRPPPPPPPAGSSPLSAGRSRGAGRQAQPSAARRGPGLRPTHPPSSSAGGVSSEQTPRRGCGAVRPGPRLRAELRPRTRPICFLTNSLATK